VILIEQESNNNAKLNHESLLEHYLNLNAPNSEKQEAYWEMATTFSPVDTSNS
jgi:hypothetical protein